MVYDIEDKILPKLWKVAPKSMSKKYFLSICIDGEIKSTMVGKKIFDKIISTPNATNLKDDTQLLVKIEMVQSAIGPLPSYDSCEFIKHPWKKPLQDLDKEKWTNWLKSGQKDLWSHLQKFDVKNHIQKVESEIGKSDIIGEILSEFRNQKLDIILE